MSMSKQISIPMETSAYYQEQSNLNVTLWNQDKNTAELKFLITRNNFPLSLSKENVKVVLALESGESFITTDGLDIDNEVEGVATYIIPPEFMAVATSVVGQIYVTTIDGDEIVVQRKFSFEVAEDLLSTIPSEEKIRYIKMFDDLRVDMNNRLGSVETAITQLESNVDAVNNARQNGIAAINSLYDAKLVTFNQNYVDKMALINSAMSDMETYVDTSLADMTQKKADFDASVSGSGLVTTGESENWQKYKMVRDDGTRTYLNKGSFTDITALAPGYYETVTAVDAAAQGFPQGISNSAYTHIDITQSTVGGRKRIRVNQSNNGRTFIKHLHTDGADGGWKEIAFIDTNDPYATVSSSSAKANVAENNAITYTNEKINNQHSVLFEGSVNGVGQIINMTESMFDYNMIIVSGSTPAGDFDRPVLVNQNSGNNIIINIVNLVDSNGNLGSVYELKLDKTNSTTLTIANDVFFDYGTNTGSGPNANRFTIKRIEGWK